MIHAASDGSFAVRRGGYKAIFTTGSGGFTDPVGWPAYPPSGGGQLYDLTADPAEAHNLWSARPEVAEALYADLRAGGA